MAGHLLEIARETWLVTAQMAPWLLLGFLVAGALSTLVAPAWLERHLGGRGFGPVVKAAAFGVPLPLCSCGVIPVGASLRAHGASRPATTAFLLSTPQTGIDSILVTWSLLGPVFAVLRPVVALFTGLFGGALVLAFAPDPPLSAPAFPLAPTTGPGAGPGPRGRLLAALRYGLVTLPADLVRPLVAGLLLAGLIGALAPADFAARWVGHGPLSILVMMLVGIPLYVCATASVPLAAGFIHLGVSPGAALAFLIAGPGTNAATLTTIGRVLGRRALAMFLVAIALSAFGAGLLLDALLPWLGDRLPDLGALPHHHEHASAWAQAAAAALVAVLAFAWWNGRRAPRPATATPAGAPPAAAAATRRYAVEGMHCSHCVQSVTRAVGELPGVSACRVDLDAGVAAVTGPTLDDAAVVAAIEALGFKGRSLGD